MCKVPNIPTGLLIQPMRDHKDPKEVLYFFVRKLVSKSQNRIYLSNPAAAPLCQFYNHAEAANMVFGHGIRDKQYVTRMLDSYDSFFETRGTGLQKKFRPDIAKLQTHHPGIFGAVQKPAHITSIKQELLAALKDEKDAVYRNQNKEYVSLKDVAKVETVNGLHVYTAQCVIEHDDQIVQLPEGIKVKYKNGDYTTYVTVLEYDNKTNTVIFQTSAKLAAWGKPRLENSPVYLINCLMERIEAADLEDNPFKSLLEKRAATITYTNNTEATNLKLDKSQQEAVSFALGHSITYIWGPPGTGKSFTLATLLLNLFLQKERTLVCAIANVAVDGLAMKLVAAVQQYGAHLLKRGEILRIGYVHDKELRKIDALFPEDEAIKKLREKIGFFEERLEKLSKTVTGYAITSSELQQAKHKLAQELRQKIQNAKIILCTSSKALLDEAIATSSFDNLVIDEGSMMAPPALAGLTSRIKKRVIVAGDFRQLGPIALAQTGMADKWLHTNLFDLLGDRLLEHPALRMITGQRRCAAPIIELVNKEFYEGRLVTIANKKQEAYRHLHPGEGHVSFIDLGQDGDYAGDYSSAHSRYNKYSLTYVMTLLHRYRNEKSLRSVGIITPYRAQVFYYQKEIDRFVEIMKPPFQVRVGTIHSFQGSECEVIIFDMVDSLKRADGNNWPISNLYYGKTGEQLINVAVSRAISKLVIVGCSKVLWEGQRHGQVNMSVKRVLRKAQTTN